MLSQTYIGRAPAEFARVQQLTASAVDAFGVDGAALTIIGATGGRLLVHATDALSFELDELQFTLGEGPCIDAKDTGSPILVDAMAGPEAQARWPGFARDAVILDVGAEFAFPLLSVGIPFAVLQTYRHDAGELSRNQLAAGRDLLETSKDLILDELAQHLSPEVAHGPLGVNDRTEIHQASGMVAVQLGIPIDDALARIRAAAYSGHVPVSAFARDVLAGQYVFREPAT
jgi:hypothetical protein